MVDDPASAPASISPRFPRRGHEPPGEDLGRIISLSDGAFAFALTLLVLTVPSFDVTGLTSAQVSGHLGALLRGDYPAFLG